ncbi:hypothetical protein BDZ91DRAFT_730691 [Kalaharituber pfeilii]|nr:hypothetical protein BDZ91DRAFT_730691 [Kalaharituber pfeilii]
MTCWDHDGGCMNLPIICSYLYDSSCCCCLGLLYLAASLHIPLNGTRPLRLIYISDHLHSFCTIFPLYYWARFSLFVFGSQQYWGIVTSS